MNKQEWFEAVSKAVDEVCPQRGLFATDAIKAQAILESGWGQSGLAATYNNFFGMKCGSGYTGKSVNMATQEEYEPGVMTNIRDNFRAYDSVKAGIEGYCDFITGFPRYANLIGEHDNYEYIKKLKADGWATSSTYVENVTRVLESIKVDKPAPAPAPAPVDDGSYTVQKGDSLWAIAQKFLGDGTRYNEIKSMNGLTSDTIYAGQVLKVKGGTPAPAPAPAPTQRTYTVVAGDSLWKIAANLLGNGARYNEIKQANGLTGDTIHPGDVLVIPQ